MTRARLLPRSAEGFTLLEVLVAVLILSVGLLGLAGLQTVGLRQNHSAFMRSQATMLAYDIIDRMRTNKVRVDACGTLDGCGYNILVNAAPPSPPVDCVAASCTVADLATYEVNDWITRISATLPLGDGGVATVGGVVTVTVAWDDNRSGTNNDPNEQFAMSTQL